jgi:integrase
MIDAANLGAAEGESPQRYRRALWIVRLTTRLKLQRSEISNLRMGDFSRSGTGAWKVSVTRKYGKKRTLVLSEDFMEDFLDYRKSLGLGSPPTAGEALKAIAPIRSWESPCRSDKVDLGVEISWLADRTLEYLGRAGPVDPAVGAFLENHPTIWFRNHSLSQKILSGWNDEFE